MRAFHQSGDGEPKILVDPVIAHLLDPTVLDAIHHAPERFQTVGMRALRSHVLLRSRYAEDELRAAADRGVTQYVLVGAGFDTFAWRQPGWAARLRIFEIDHPAAQRAKRERLARAGLSDPQNLEFVPADLERDLLDEALAARGFDRRQPAFCSSLGVMVYLTPRAVDATLRYVGSLGPGTTLVSTFSPPAAAGQEGSERSMTAADAAAALGEPWLTRLEPAELEAKLRAVGFSDVTFLTPSEAERRYFLGRTDGLPAPRRVRIARAAR